jgi:hypothetical protein
MNILRPLYPHLSHIFQRWSIPFLFLATIVLFFYLICLQVDVLNFFISVLSKVGLRVGGRALFFFFGCHGSLTLAIAFAFWVLTGEPSLIWKMMPSGEGTSGTKLPLSVGDGGSGASSSRRPPFLLI